MLALFVFVSALCWYGAFRWRRRRLYELAARVPGLPDLPFIGNAHQFSGNSQCIMKGLQDLSRCAMENNGLSKGALGPLVYFLLINPVDVEMILKTCLEKDDLHRFVRNIIGYGGIFAPVSIWRRRRKIMAPTFSPRVLDQFVEVFAAQSDTLARRLVQQRDGAGAFSVWPYLNTYTLDSIFESTLGMKIDAQKNENIPFLTSLNIVLDVVCKRIFHLWLQPNWLYKLFPVYQQQQKNIKVLHEFTDNVIINRKEQIQANIHNNNATEVDHRVEMNPSERKTFLELLITSSGGMNGYSNEELREEVLTLVIAATDTSAVALGYTLMLLAKYPEVQDRVYQELCDVFGKSERVLVREDLPKLVYTERVIKESLRLFPPGPFIIRKIEKEIVLPSGRILPAGSGAVVSIWGAHRDPAHWGPDAYLEYIVNYRQRLFWNAQSHFDPDRFLPERYRPRHACSFMPFSHGPRNCLGYQYAMISVKTALSTILRHCRILGEPEKGPSPQIDVKLEIMMKPVNNFELKLERRK